jgi:hypothetical protein
MMRRTTRIGGSFLFATSLFACGGFSIDPGDIPVDDLVLWLDASAIANLSDGDDVSIWHDQSGQGHHAIQPDTSHQPIYVARGIGGRPAVRFLEDCGVNAPIGSCRFEYLTVPGIGSEFTAGAATMFVVADVQDLDYAIYSTGESTDRELCEKDFCDQHWRFHDGNGYVGLFHTSRIDSWPPSPPAEGLHLFVLRTGGTYEFTIDGAGGSPQPASFATGADHTIGAGDPATDSSTQAQRFFNGRVAEILVYDRALSDSELARTARYLRTRWGMPLL